MTRARMEKKTEARHLTCLLFLFLSLLATPALAQDDGPTEPSDETTEEISDDIDPDEIIDLDENENEEEEDATSLPEEDSVAPGESTPTTAPETTESTEAIAPDTTKAPTSSPKTIEPSAGEESKTPADSEESDSPVVEKLPERDPADPPDTSPLPNLRSTFTFGSYARVRAATDLEGGRARPVNVVTHGSRIDEFSYAELEFQQLFEVPKEDGKYYTQLVATLAFLNDFFHYTGDFDQTFAFRNLYAEAGWRKKALTLSFWGGSRMYRGDDIYLLDFWPLDNLNTVGGGIIAAYDERGFGRTEFKLHTGANRLANPYQYGVASVPAVTGTEDIAFLNRQRVISSARLQQDIWLGTREDASPTWGTKIMLYGEDHRLPGAITRDYNDLNQDGDPREEVLPAESGRKLGTELGLWTAEGLLKGSFVNLFLVHATDLAAYGEFGIPSGINVNETSEGARSWMVATSADLETPYFGMLVGAYYKYFQDADRNSTDFDDYWESIFSARAHGYVTDHIHPGVEFSYQVRRPEGPSPRTGLYEAPTVTKLSFIQALTLKKGMYSRPQLRLIYSRAWLNESALSLYNPEDPRSRMSAQNYLGVMVEWWFNNASLFRP